MQPPAYSVICNQDIFGRSPIDFLGDQQHRHLRRLAGSQEVGNCDCILLATFQQQVHHVFLGSYPIRPTHCPHNPEWKSPCAKSRQACAFRRAHRVGAFDTYSPEVTSTFSYDSPPDTGLAIIRVCIGSWCKHGSLGSIIGSHLSSTS